MNCFESCIIGIGQSSVWHVDKNVKKMFITRHSFANIKIYLK
jgi:hypothetical protein